MLKWAWWIAIGVSVAWLVACPWLVAHATPQFKGLPLRGYDFSINEPWIQVTVSDDVTGILFQTQDTKFSSSLAVAAAVSFTTPGYWRCQNTPGMWRTCRLYLGASVCVEGTANACHWWKDDATSTTPLPVLPHGLYTVRAAVTTTAANGAQTYAEIGPVTEANLTCLCTCEGGPLDKQACLTSGLPCPGLKRNGQPAERSSGCPCRMLANGAPGVQEGATCLP